MKSVLLSVAGLLFIISVRAQNQCGAPTYTRELSPIQCLSNTFVKLPYYPDLTKYYDCRTGTPILTPCPVAGQVFNNAYQECTTCARYLPTVACDGLGWNLPCAPFTAEPATTTVGSTTPAATTNPTTSRTATTGTTTTPSTTTTASPNNSNGPPTASPVVIPTPPNL